MNDLLMLFLPAGISALAGKLRNKDANTTGADDAIAGILTEIAPAVPQLIQGNVGDNVADKVMLGIYDTSRAYLVSRGKLPA